MMRSPIAGAAGVSSNAQVSSGETPGPKSHALHQGKVSGPDKQHDALRYSEASIDEKAMQGMTADASGKASTRIVGPMNTPTTGLNRAADNH
jgi:hypothetical protein